MNYKQIKKAISAFIVLILVFCLFSISVFAQTEYDYDINAFQMINENFIITSSAISNENTSLNIDEMGDICLTDNALVNYTFYLQQDSAFAINVTYSVISANSNSLAISFSFDNTYQFEEMKAMKLPVMWKDSGEIRTDSIGNEYPAEQTIYDGYINETLKDDTGVNNLPYVFYLSKGYHSMAFSMVSGEIKLKQIEFSAIKQIPPYDKLDYKNSGSTNKERIVIEGEDTYFKNRNSLIPKSDNSDPTLSPISSNLTLLNYIYSSEVGEELIWKFDVKKSGYYKIAFKFKQNELINGISYRTLKIDGVTPFSEANSIGFEYGTKWQFKEFCTSDENPYYIFLDSGTHELSLEVTMAQTADFYLRLNDIVSKIGDEYLKITMITGETPDANRDYELFKQIPDFNKTLQSVSDDLKKVSEDMKKSSGKRSNSIIAAINNMDRVLISMIDNPYTAHQYVADYYTNYSTVSSWLYEMKSMPLALDQIVLTGKGSSSNFKDCSWINKLIFGIKRFVASFSTDYNSLTGSSNTDKSVSIWVNWGRDQAQVLANLITEDFTSKTGIHVDLKIVNASLVNGILVGNPPDVTLQMSRTEPVNLAMRDALYDLSNFEDFGDVIKRFQNGAITPYEYEGGCYALPDTQSFYLMYYRKDILDMLGVSVPNSWQEFIDATATLQRNKMQTWLPYTRIASTTTVNTGIGGLSIFPSLMLQNGLSLYNDEKNACTLSSKDSMNVFVNWTNFYTQYKLLKEANFYNRFRSGTMPLGIESYTLYQQLSETAPEINGRWGVALVPGTENSDATLNHTVSGAGTGAVILKDSNAKKEAWEFLKWWTSSDVQLRYSNNLESILGPIGRVASSNVQAVRSMSWNSKDIEIILKQWDNVEEIPEIPGSYYLTRAVDQAFWSVVNSIQPAKDALVEWGRVANDEITRKIQEYN